jgi:hypothetical protein
MQTMSRNLLQFIGLLVIVAVLGAYAANSNPDCLWRTIISFAIGAVVGALTYHLGSQRRPR